MAQTFEQEIAGAVLRHFIDTGNALDAPAIAAALGCSESKVRKALAAHGGLVPGVVIVQGERATYSKNYPSMQHGVVKVWLYEPTKAALRECALAAMGGVVAMRVTEAQREAAHRAGKPCGISPCFCEAR